jgi:hypothetical protein
LSFTVLNGRNRNGVRRTPSTFGFRRDLHADDDGHVPQSAQPLSLMVDLVPARAVGDPLRSVDQPIEPRRSSSATG